MHSLSKTSKASGNCAVCGKSLGGFFSKAMKCSTCGVAVHSGCKDKLPSNCGGGGGGSSSHAAAAAAAPSKKAGKSSTKAKGADNDFLASLGITDDMLNGDLDDFDDADMDNMDDSALMSEINKPIKKGKKGKSPAGNAAAAAPSKSNPDDVLKDATKLANMKDEDFDNIELTDDDLNDPELLGELEMLGEPSLEELEAEVESEKQKFQQCKVAKDLDGARKHAGRVTELNQKIRDKKAKLGIDIDPAPKPAPAPAPAPAAVPQPKPQPIVTAAPAAPAAVQPKPAAAAPAAKPQRKMTPVMPTQSFMGRMDNEEEEFRVSIYKELEDFFTKKEYDLKKKAVEAKQANDKDKALELFREAKKTKETVEALAAARTHPSKPMPPEFKRVKHRSETVVTNSDLDLKQMELTIVKLSNLMVPGYTNLSTYVYADHTIDERQPKIHFQSEVIANNFNPEFNFKTIIDIERTRSIGSLYDRKKIPVIIYHKRALKDMPIGKFDIPLNAVVNKAKAAFTCQILAGDMKHKMGKATATVMLRLNKPLVGDDVNVTETEEIVLTGPIFDPATAPVTTPSPQPASPAPAPAPVTTAAAAPAPAPAAVAAPQPKPQQPQAKKVASKYNFPKGHAFTEDEKESLIDDTYKIEKYNSMELAEWETERVNKEIAMYKASKKPVPDDLVDRPKLLEDQSNMLVIRVQTGKLTIEGYLAHLEKMVVADNELLAVLTMAGLAKEVGIVKERIKILQGEIASANEEGDE